MASPVNFNAAASPGALAGQPQGPLSGNGGFWDQLWPAAAGAALLAGPSLRQGVANAAAAIVPALQQDRRRAAINAWLKAKSSGGQVDPATLQLLQSDPSLGESMASTMLAPHPKQLSFDRFGRGYVVEPYSGAVQPLPQAAGGVAAADDGGTGTGEVIPGVGPVVPMNRLLGRAQKIGTDASGQTLWRDQTGQVARGPAMSTDMAESRRQSVIAQIKNGRDTLYRLGGLKPGDDPANITVPNAGADPVAARQWADATNQIRDGARTLEAMKPDNAYDEVYLPQMIDKPSVRGTKMNKLNAMIDQGGTMGGG